MAFRLRGLLFLGFLVPSLLLLLVPPAAADEFADLVAKLGAESFSDKEAAVAALGTLADPRAVAPLQALAQGKLALTDGGKRVVIAEPDGDRFTLIDAASGAKIDTVAADALARVRVNNRLRGAIDAALSGLQIFSGDAQKRLAAAREAGKTATPQMAAMLEKALAAEKVSEVRAAMTASLNQVKLKTGTPAERIKAITALGDSADPELRGMLMALAGAPDTPPEVKAAADARPRRSRASSGSSSLSAIWCRASVSARSCCWPRSGSPSPSASWASSTWPTAR
ncbi:MAG: hypothetical protein ACHQF3_10470 [Alphaproteobacteria bacterium]